MKKVLWVFVVLAVLGVIGWGLRFFYKRDQNVYRLWEEYNEIELLRNDYESRDPYEFLNDHGVRGAADGGIEYFRKGREDVLQRFGGGNVD